MSNNFWQRFDRVEKAAMMVPFQDIAITEMQKQIDDLSTELKQFRAMMEQQCKDLTTFADGVKFWRKNDLDTHAQALNVIDRFDEELEKASQCLQEMVPKIIEHEHRIKALEDKQSSYSPELDYEVNGTQLEPFEPL